jgi:RNA polymerase sigma-70 factor, ECF subfamily
MNWENTIPKVQAVDAPQIAEPVMDDQAFAGFYQRTAPSLWAYLVRVSRDPALSDDLMQESYLRFLTKDTKVDGEVASRRYLFGIATNLMRDHWRRPRQTPIDEIPEVHFASPDGKHLERMDSQARLDAAFTHMKPRERQLLWLAHAEDYSHREIAQITGLGEMSIRLLLFRARRKIAQVLKKQTAGVKP